MCFYLCTLTQYVDTRNSRENYYNHNFTGTGAPSSVTNPSSLSRYDMNNGASSRNSANRYDSSYQSGQGKQIHMCLLYFFQISRSKYLR